MEKISMTERHVIKQAQVARLGPAESRDSELFTADTDGVIANVVYRPAEDIHGHWYRLRFAGLRLEKTDERDGRHLAGGSAWSGDFFLPAGVAQNVPLTWLNRLNVREGETLYWSSQLVPDRLGVADPGGTVEVMFEPRNIGTGGDDYYVPEYWQGKTLALVYLHTDPANLPHRGGTLHSCQHVGEFVRATERGILLDIQTPWEFGRNTYRPEFLHRQIESVRLL
jgi:hypothetical protein